MFVDSSDEGKTCDCSLMHNVGICAAAHRVLLLPYTCHQHFWYSPVFGILRFLRKYRCRTHTVPATLLHMGMSSATNEYHSANM
jgi:hypothetical protein